MDVQPSVTVDPAQLAYMQKKQVLQANMRGGVNWFYWIGGLSILNTVLYFFGAKITFVVGLGMTQFVDGFVIAWVEESQATGITLIHVFGLFINLIIAGIFILFGFLGNKRNRWAIIVGMILYFLDALLFVAFFDLVPLIWHALGLFFLWRGLNALAKLNALEKTAPVVIPRTVVDPQFYSKM